MQNNLVIANNHWEQKHLDTQQTIFSNKDKGEGEGQKYSQLKASYEPKYKVGWIHMQPKPRQCFNIQLLHELIHCQTSFRNSYNSQIQPIQYTILSSNKNEIFNLGGDLSFFENCISTNNKKSLMEYANLCIDAVYLNYSTSAKVPITTIALVQGDALGGGFESALSSDILIAERGTKLGLPEVLFNMFPGMGAYSFLSRKISVSETKKMIASGKLYLAEELYDMGIIDVLAEQGYGDTAVYNYIQKEERSKNSFKALQKASRVVNPVTYEELKSIVDIWVDSAMNLEKKDLRMMQKIVERQSKSHLQKA